MREVIEADRNHPLRSRHQLPWARAAHPVALHVAHLAVPALFKPVQQVRLVLFQIQVGDAHLVEAQFPSPSVDGTREIRQRIGHYW